MQDCLNFIGETETLVMVKLEFRVSVVEKLSVIDLIVIAIANLCILCDLNGPFGEKCIKGNWG